MPFIMTKINFSLDEMQEKNLKFGIANSMKNAFGLTENYILAGFDENFKMYLRGDKNQKIAFIEVSLFGNEEHIGYAEFFSEMTKVFVEVLSIPPKNIYIKFDDISVWGVGGKIFDRNDYQ